MRKARYYTIALIAGARLCIAFVALGCCCALAQLPALPSLPTSGATGQATPASNGGGVPAGLPALPLASNEPQQAVPPPAGAPPGAPPGLPSLPGLSAGENLAPPPAPQLPADRISQPDVAKVQRRKDVEDALVVIREAFYKQDWQAAKEAISAAEKVDANAPQLQVYRNLLSRKLAEQGGDGVPALRTPRPGGPTLESLHLPAAATPAPMPLATMAPTITAANTATVPLANGTSPAASRKKKLVALFGALVLAGIGWGVYKLLSRNKPAEQEPEESAHAYAAGLSAGMLPDPNIVSARAPAGPPPKLMFQEGSMDDQVTMVEDQQTLVEDHATLMDADADSVLSFGAPIKPRTEDDHPQDADSIARAIAQNLQQIKPKAPETAPQFELFSGALPGEQTNYLEDEGGGSPANFAAPPKPVSEQKAAAEPPKAAAKMVSDTVSFEDLGISFGPSEPAPVLPPATSQPEPAAPQLPSATPAAASASAAPLPAPAPVREHDELRLDDLTIATPPKQQPVGEPVGKPLSGTGAIDLQQVLFGKSPEAPSISLDQPFAATPDLPGQPDKPPVQLPSLDDLKPTPRAPSTVAASPSLEDTYGAAGDTFHSQDTIGIASQTNTSAAPGGLSLDGTIGFAGTSPTPIDPALAATKTASQPAAPQESYYAASPKGGESQLDERSEKMFREQYDRAQKAMNDRNWRQAVHYLSIAAAIHPDNEQVRDQLKEARAQKRKQEAGV